jgi:hypothetical protein
MGSIFIYITKETLTPDWSISDLDGKVLKQRSAYLLDKIVEKLPNVHRDLFPTLLSLEFSSGNYIDEHFYLLSRQVKQLKQEFDTILEILLKRQFLNNVDSDTIISYLCKDGYPHSTKDEILNELFEIKDLIDFAANEECNIYIDR